MTSHQFVRGLPPDPQTGRRGAPLVIVHVCVGLAERLRGFARAVCPSGAVLAEITGGSTTTNLNLHDRLIDYEIVCPGESSAAPEDKRTGIDDLYVEHDAGTDRLVLRSRRLACEVVPVYLGYLVPLALPEITRTLLLFSPTSMARPDVWGGVPEGTPADGVTARPRVRLGPLVLSRRSWTTRASALPARSPGAPDSEWFLRWQSWRCTHRLPDRVFATVSGADRAMTAAKPQYVDFDSLLSLLAFEGLLGGGDAPRRLPRDVAGRRRVARHHRTRPPRGRAGHRGVPGHRRDRGTRPRT